MPHKSQLMRTTLITLGLLTLTCQAFAGGLPPPSRTVYKCEDGKKVYYSDSPCLGATKVDVTPTRGLNKSSGRELVGSDVRREQTHEQFAEAVRPVTGMNAQQLDKFGRRMQLTPEAQRRCQELDRLLPQAEQAERSAPDAAQAKFTQTNLFTLRKQYRDLRCE